MGDAEKNTYISLVCTVLIMSCYSLILFIHWADYQTIDASRLVGKSIFFLILISALLNFGLKAIVKTISSIHNKTCAKPLSDERDKIIELNGLQVSYLVFTLGFITAMLLLWAGYSTVIVFNILIFSFAFGEIFSSSLKIIQYRRGF